MCSGFLTKTLFIEFLLFFTFSKVLKEVRVYEYNACLGITGMQ